MNSFFFTLKLILIFCPTIQIVLKQLNICHTMPCRGFFQALKPQGQSFYQEEYIFSCASQMRKYLKGSLSLLRFTIVLCIFNKPGLSCKEIQNLLFESKIFKVPPFLSGQSLAETKTKTKGQCLIKHFKSGPIFILHAFFKCKGFVQWGIVNGGRSFLMLSI